MSEAQTGCRRGRTGGSNVSYRRIPTEKRHHRLPFSGLRKPSEPDVTHSYVPPRAGKGATSVKRSLGASSLSRAHSVTQRRRTENPTYHGDACANPPYSRAGYPRQFFWGEDKLGCSGRRSAASRRFSLQWHNVSVHGTDFEKWGKYACRPIADQSVRSRQRVLSQLPVEQPQNQRRWNVGHGSHLRFPRHKPAEAPRRTGAIASRMLQSFALLQSEQLLIIASSEALPSRC